MGHIILRALVSSSFRFALADVRRSNFTQKRRSPFLRHYFPSNSFPSVISFMADETKERYPGFVVVLGESDWVTLF